MAGEFAAIQLGEVAAVRSGFAFKSSDWTESGVPVVKIANVKDGRLEMNGCSFVSQRTADHARDSKLHAGDILIAMTGYIGDVAMVRDENLPALLNQRVGRFVVRDQRRLDSHFLFYLLRNPEVRQEIEGLGYGSAQPNVSPTLIQGVKIPLPPLPEQRAIAHILGTLDDRIEANRRMAATLEEMARALFRAWFVTFEPVRAKAEGRWRPGQTLPGLPASLYDAFPDRLVETEHGEIPEGWRWWLLEELAVLHRASLSPGAEPDRVFEHYSIPAYDNGQEPVQDRGETIKSNKILVPADAILLSKLNPESNRVWLPKAESAHPKIASTEFLCFTPKAPAGRALLYCAFRGEPFRRALEGMVTGTSKSHQRVSPDSVLRLQVCPARREVFDGFEKQVWPLLDRTNACREESRILISLRDALLPKLVSGAIRVKDAEAFLKARGL
jgi:type I restriction enzyme S subunit